MDTDNIATSIIYIRLGEYMTSKNFITGDLLKSKSTTQSYRDNWDLIFSKKSEEKSDSINKDLNPLSEEIEPNANNPISM